MSLYVDNDCCFACGELNPLGLHLKFRVEGERLVTSFVIQPHLQGFAGVVHGGIIATVLDDLMTNAVARFFNVLAVTAEVTVRYKKPAMVGEMLKAVATIDERRGRIFRISSVLLRGSDNEPLAQAKATSIVPTGHLI